MFIFSIPFIRNPVGAPFRARFCWSAFAGRARKGAPTGAELRRTRDLPHPPEDTRCSVLYILPTTVAGSPKPPLVWIVHFEQIGQKSSLPSKPSNLFKLENL